MLDEVEVVKQLISSYARNFCDIFWIFKLVFPMCLVAVTLMADSHCDESRLVGPGLGFILSSSPLVHLFISFVSDISILQVVTK
jgi:hypothetical protein